MIHAKAMDRLPDQKREGLTTLLQGYADTRGGTPKSAVWPCVLNQIRAQTRRIPNTELETCIRMVKVTSIQRSRDTYREGKER